MIKIEEGSVIISGTNEDVQAEYLTITDALLQSLTTIDKHILFVTTAHEFVKSFGLNKEE